MAKQRPLLLPEPFSGEASSNWDEWLVYFENCAAVNSWESDEEKLKWIRVRLTGKAQTALQRFLQMPTQSIVAFSVRQRHPQTVDEAASAPIEVESYVRQNCVPTPVLWAGQSNVSGNTAVIPCTFLNGSSHYCVVCCSTDPSVPPDSSVYNISTTRGTEVTVSLQGLTSGQMYYCKAAATNTNSNNCAGSVVGDPTSSSIDVAVTVGTAVGVVVGIAIAVGVCVVVTLGATSRTRKVTPPPRTILPSADYDEVMPHPPAGDRMETAVANGTEQRTYAVLEKVISMADSPPVPAGFETPLAIYALQGQPD
eukprot:Em0166g12a